MTDIPHDHLGQPDLQALVRQCGGFDKISLELWTAWDRANAEWQERAWLEARGWPEFKSALVRVHQPADDERNAGNVQQAM